MILQTKSTVRQDGVGWTFDGGDLDGKSIITYDLNPFKDQEVIVKYNPFSRGGTWEVLSVILYANLIDSAPNMLAELEADEDAAQLSPASFFNKHGYNVSERGERRRAVIAKAK